MFFIFVVTAILAGVAALLAFTVQGGFSRRRRRQPGFWKRFLVRQLVLLPVYVFVLGPGLLGCAGSRMVRTRGDERAYAGPRFDAAGDWQLQDRGTLKAPAAAAPNPFRVTIDNPGGPRLGGYYVPCRHGAPRAVALLVHGLFRNAMEVEPVAAMFRDAGADTLLLELRNHGGSEARPFSFGLREAQDVLAGVEYLRRRPGGLKAPLILFGISMGGITVARAAPQVPELAGLVLDAPMPDLDSTAHRQLGRIEWQGRHGLGLPGFYVSIVLRAVELWSGFDADDVRPIDQLKGLPPRLPVLLIGAGRDVRVPPPVVEAVFRALRAPEGTKEMWIGAEARHGHVFTRYPEEYRKRIAALVERVAGR